MSIRRSVARWATLATVAVAGLAVAALAPAHALDGGRSVPKITKQLAASTTGHFQVTVFSSTDSNGTKFARAICPSGTRVLGGGGRITNGNGFVMLRISKPVRSRTGVEGYAAQADEIESGYGGTWSVTATAVCGNALPGLEIVESPERTGTSPNQSTPATAFCSSGKEVIGMGGTVVDKSNQKVTGRVSLTGVVPGTITNGQLPARATSVTAFGRQDNRGFTSSSYTVKATAVCATTAPGYKVVGGVATSTALSQQTVVASCPTGTVPHGVGFRLQDPSALTYVDQAFQNVVKETFVHAQNPFSSGVSWSLTPYAICAA
jgi:hypothetical protein